MNVSGQFHSSAALLHVEEPWKYYLWSRFMSLSLVQLYMKWTSPFYFLYSSRERESSGTVPCYFVMLL